MAVGEEAARIVREDQGTRIDQEAVKSIVSGEVKRVTGFFNPLPCNSVRPYKVKEKIQDIVWETASIIRRQLEMDEAWS